MEPSPEIRTERSVPTKIPLEVKDQTKHRLFDYSHTGWQGPKINEVEPEMFFPYHELPSKTTSCFYCKFCETDWLFPWFSSRAF
jgi:hypothetical protein